MSSRLRASAVRTFLLAAASSAACGGPLDRANANAAADQSCAPGQTVEGIDVSKYDGDIDWNAVAADGRAFAFIRVSDGLGFPDAYFAANWANAKAAGLYRGVYQYFEPDQDATQQANLVLSALGSDVGELPAVVDIETTNGVSPDEIRTALDTWSSVIQQGTGRSPIVYVSPGFWSSVGGGDESDDLWVANWSVSCPSLPPAWSAWSFWQYTDSGSVGGISGQVDLDQFNGSLADLAAYASGGGGSGDAGSDGGCQAQVPPGDIARSDAVANAEQWVTAKLAYCQSANGESDPDPACSSTCQRQSDPQWDPYRSDCSGLVSWAWQLAAPGLSTDLFAPFDTSVSNAIQCTDLKPGDAVNRNSGGHMALFKQWVTPGQRAVFVEEPGCSAAEPWAHEFTSDVTCSGTDVDITYEGETYTAIAYDNIADDPCGGGGGGG